MSTLLFSATSSVLLEKGTDYSNIKDQLPSLSKNPDEDQLPSLGKIQHPDVFYNFTIFSI